MCAREYSLSAVLWHDVPAVCPDLVLLLVLRHRNGDSPVIAEKFKQFVVVDGEAPLIVVIGNVIVPCVKDLLVVSTHCQYSTGPFAFIAFIAHPCPASVHVYATPDAIVSTLVLQAAARCTPFPPEAQSQKKKNVEMSNQLQKEKRANDCYCTYYCSACVHHFSETIIMPQGAKAFPEEAGQARRVFIHRVSATFRYTLRVVTTSGTYEVYHRSIYMALYYTYFNVPLLYIYSIYRLRAIHAEHARKLLSVFIAG